MTELIEIIAALHIAFESGDVPHAFGGALSLAFHVEEPRATRDVDVNVFLPVEQVERVFAALPPEVQHGERDVRRVRRDGQVRLFWADTPVDVFFSTHAFHDTAQRHRIIVTLGGENIPVLGSTELTVFKAFFDRTKDWADIEAMAEAGTIDAVAAIGWMRSLLGADDDRCEHLRQILEHPQQRAEGIFRP